MSYVKFEDILVNRTLYDVVNNEIAPGTGVSSDTFWSATARLLREYGPVNERLLRKRDRIQAQIDEYHMGLRDSGRSLDPIEYSSFLSSIGYIVPRGNEFSVTTSNVDDEIARIPGPQLVVPVDNSRYALNAANARWGSLLDAFYGTDAGPAETNGAERGTKGYNPIRGKRVFEYAHKFLDDYFPLSSNVSYNNITEFSVLNNNLLALTQNRNNVNLVNTDQFVGFNRNSNGDLSSVLLRNNGLHVELLIDRNSSIGRTHLAGLKDIYVESAVTAIADCEDSVSAVDASDKSIVYRNWCGLMRGDLNTKLTKNGREVIRRLNEDKTFLTRCGKKTFTVPGRALLLVRNVGLHMYTDAVLTERNEQVPEGLIDLMVTSLAALHDLNKSEGNLRNSRQGSMYIVKPKMHGPEETRFVISTFEFAEKVLNLRPNTLKIGIMDEERRTTVNLYECIREARYRCIFINTGFLDRTGDEIHTSFYAGPVLVKSDIKKALWRTAYEKYNVEIGLQVGLLEKGQIGKGMWAAPNAMAEMLATKSNHPLSGATCAWVPSPTAATLHAIHYHQTNVLEVQKGMLANISNKSISNLLQNILVPPILNDVNLYDERTVLRELENNAQGILGYVVRWVEFGVGCSTVPDLNDVGLMEDRATLRISSQHIANWLYHGIVSQELVVKVFERMSKIVDRQNVDGGKSQGYRPMYNNFERNNAFQCALELVMNGKFSNNGLTEDILTKYRKRDKSQVRSKL